MANEQLPHLRMAGRCSTERYTRPRGGGGSSQIPQRNRQRHGQSLLDKLDIVRQDAEQLNEQRSAYGVAVEAGICIHFQGEPNHALAIDSLENVPLGIELLSVHRTQDCMSATVFVPHGKISFFVGRIEAYLTESSKSGNPKNQKMVANISDIRTAVLNAFWTDTHGLFPSAGEAIWWEVWLRVNSNKDEVEAAFREYAEAYEIAVAPLPLCFPGRLVLLAWATQEQIMQSIELLNLIAELRRGRIRVNEYTDLGMFDKVEFVSDLSGRLQPADPNAAAVCILDTGVNRGHPLLSSSLAPNVCMTQNPSWGTSDHSGHGTEIAGLALLGDLAPILESTGPVQLEHHLESVKILPPSGDGNSPNLYGAITQEAVHRAEIETPSRGRVICLTATLDVPDSLVAVGAVTEENCIELLEGINEFHRQGRPSTWSAAIDDLAVGLDGEPQRLVIMAAGNTQPPFRRYYPNSNYTESIQDPGQAWNALTIGAYTEKTLFDENQYPGWELVAKRGELSPSSTTSMVWQEQWPTKPDLCLEGGNQAIEPASGEADYIDDLQMLTTNSAFASFQSLKVTGDTSAATGLAARMAAQVMTQYPNYRAETIRALLVHSARWTDAMTSGRDIGSYSRGDMKSLLRRVGYGVPEVNRARWSAQDQLTLITEETLQPFEKVGSKVGSKDMHIHRLPWPKEELEALGETLVTLRVTLSYFIEPNPSDRGWSGRHRYASHGLRFDVKTPHESVIDFRKRLSTAARDDSDTKEDITANDQAEWSLGTELRHKGSIHSDSWRGTAAALASRGCIGVYPVIGWWRENKTLKRWDSAANYSLIVSIEAPGVELELYTAVATQIATEVELS